MRLRRVKRLEDVLELVICDSNTCITDYYLQPVLNARLFLTRMSINQPGVSTGCRSKRAGWSLGGWTFCTSGIINRSFFWWLNPLLLTGFFKNLAVNDLFTLDEQLVSENLQDSLQSGWHEGWPVPFLKLFLVLVLKLIIYGVIQ